VDFAGWADAALAVAIDREGRIVAGGSAYHPERSTDFALVRLEGSGPPGVEVSEVSVGGSSWATPFVDYLRRVGVGGAGGRVLTSYAIAPGFLPIITQAGLDRVTARVRRGTHDLGVNDLRVRGANVVTYDVAGFTYDRASGLATWTLARPVENDRVVFEINTAGDARPEVRLPMDVLAGSADRNGQVDALDVAEVKARLTRTTESPGTPGAPGAPGAYSHDADVNADGRINALDVSAVKRRLTSRLPASWPAAADVVPTPTRSGFGYDRSVTKQVLTQP
jgi:hypothetical protein